MWYPHKYKVLASNPQGRYLQQHISLTRLKENFHNAIHGILRNFTTSLLMDGIQTWDILLSIKDLLFSVWLDAFLDVSLQMTLKDAMAGKLLQIIWVLSNFRHCLQWKHLKLAKDAKTLSSPFHYLFTTSYLYRFGKVEKNFQIHLIKQSYMMAFEIFSWNYMWSILLDFQPPKHILFITLDLWC